MHQYLIIAETEDTGYFVELHNSLKTAMERCNLYFELAFNPPIDLERLNKEFTLIGCYPIYEQYIYLGKSHGGISNGFYSTEVIEVEIPFNRRRYALLRGSAQSAFKGEQLDDFYDLDEKYGTGMVRTVWVN